MSAEEIADIVRYTLLIATQISAPILVITFVLGLSISIFQSVTQISETTLIFIPKLFMFCVTLAICFPWMVKILTKFCYDILVDRWNQIVMASSYAM